MLCLCEQWTCPFGRDAVTEVTHFSASTHNQNKTHDMAWGKKKGVEDLVQRLAANDPQLKSLTILRWIEFVLRATWEGNNLAKRLFAPFAYHVL
jgi:hypothetical protein